jgi:hypothetical protein
MRILGAEPSPLRRLVPWLAALIILAALAGLVFWGRTQETARLAAEGRAQQAEERLVEAQASLTALARAGAAATATALAQANLPDAALKRALDLVYEAYKDPTDAKLRALTTAFSPDALSVERREAEHLLSSGTHLAGATPFEMTILSSSTATADQAQVRTHEVWTYDEVDAQNRKTRCLKEESDQTYTLRRVPGGWLVEDIELGTTRRTDC